MSSILNACKYLLYIYNNLWIWPHRSKEAIYILCWRFDSDSKWTSSIQRTTWYIKCVSILIYLLVLWKYEKIKHLDHLKNQVDEFISRLYYPPAHYFLLTVFKVLNNLFLSTKIQCPNYWIIIKLVDFWKKKLHDRCSKLSGIS